VSGDIPQQLKQDVRKRHNHSCYFCGRGVNHSHSDSETHRHLHCHHINGDDTDYRLGNLILLCGSCHQCVHNKDEPPFRRFHRALPREQRKSNSPYEGDQEQPPEIHDCVLSAWADRGLPGHRYKRKHDKTTA